MVCVYCGGKTQVRNSRHQVKSNQVWRRRHCLSCGAVFTTEETTLYELAWVVRTNGTFVPFSRDKLLISLLRCCEHRQYPLRDAQGLVRTILGKLVTLPSSDAPHTLHNQEIAHAVLVALNRFDRVAAVRYQSLHRFTLPDGYQSPVLYT